MGIVSLLGSLFIAAAFAKPILVGQTDVGNHPESATGDGNFIYVSNMGPNGDLKKTGDGYISRLSLDGKLLEKVFLPTRGRLHSPTGMAVSRGRLYVNDLDRVVGFNLSKRRQSVVVDLSAHGVTFLNDIVFVDSTRAVVSATYSHQLFLVDFVRRTAEELKVPVQLQHPNGLAYDSQRSILYVAGNQSPTIGETDANGLIHAFQLYRKVALVGVKKNLGKFVDGLAFVSGALLLTDWGGWGRDGKLVQITRHSPQVYPLGLKGTADFHWHSPLRRLFIAQLTEGKVAVVDF